MHAQGFNQRYGKHNVTAYSLNPGYVASDLYRHMGFQQAFAAMIAHMFGKTVPEGAATTLFCALSSKAVAGEYHDDCNVDARGQHPFVHEQSQVDALWYASEKIVRDKLPSAFGDAAA